jgi:hypothetical protein
MLGFALGRGPSGCRGCSKNALPPDLNRGATRPGLAAERAGAGGGRPHRPGSWAARVRGRSRRYRRTLGARGRLVTDAGDSEAASDPYDLNRSRSTYCPFAYVASGIATPFMLESALA